MSHILFISPYYPPEKAAAAVCVSENAKRLAARGHRVTVLTTFPNYPTGIIPPEYRGYSILREELDGVEVVRVWKYASANKGFVRRILAQFSFGFTAPLLGWKAVGHPDMIIVQSPPLFDAIAVRLLAAIKRRPFIFMVSDLWPESAVQLGALRNRLFIKLAEWLEWSTYKRAKLVWAVTEGIYSRLIERGLPSEKILLLTNGVDTVKFHPIPQVEAREAFDWGDKFVVLYAGTHGLSHGLVTILDAAEKLLGRPEIQFVLVGDGAEKAELVAQARARGLHNLLFLDPLPHEKMPQLICAADVCLAHARNIPLFKGMLPIKMFEAMACGQPIVLALDGEARQVVEQEASAAVYAEAENPDSLMEAILWVHEHPEQARLVGERARTLVTARFDYDQLATILDMRIAKLLEKQVVIAPAIPSLSTSGDVRGE